MQADISHTQDVINTTKRWLKKAVIGLNLCPFANAVYANNKIRFFVSTATAPEALASDLLSELKLLHATTHEKTDTTLIIHPFTLNNFLNYNDFLDVANNLVVDAKLDTYFQIASFHPEYQFAGTQANDIENYTNRSPYPMLHILREDSVSKAVTAFPEAELIFEKNIATMQTLGHAGWLDLELDAVKTKK